MSESKYLNNGSKTQQDGDRTIIERERAQNQVFKKNNSKITVIKTQTLLGQKGQFSWRKLNLFIQPMTIF